MEYKESLYRNEYLDNFLKIYTNEKNLFSYDTCNKNSYYVKNVNYYKRATIMSYINFYAQLNPPT